jgi:spore coat protein CotF
MNAMNTQAKCAYQDKDRMMDALSSQKFLSGVYNESLNEAYHTPVKNCLSNLLDDVHRTQEELFALMNERGWHPVEDAETQKVEQARLKFATKG